MGDILEIWEICNRNERYDFHYNLKKKNLSGIDAESYPTCAIKRVFEKYQRMILTNL